MPGISGHGTFVAVARAATPLVFTTISELGGDIVAPDLTRKEIDTSVHNHDIDFTAHGMLRRGAITFPVNYVAGDATHDNITGLYALIRLNEIVGLRVTFPDGDVWVSSGQVSSLKKKAPLDDKLVMDVSFKPSGLFTINGMVIGS